MKRILQFFCIILLHTFIASCTTDSVTSETSETEIPKGIDSLSNQLSHYDKNVQKIIQDPNGLVKGFTLHMSGDLVKAKSNDLQLVDSINNTYTIQLDPVEAADYIFQISENKLSKIEVVIYPENEYRQGVYYRELKEYYSSKFNTKATEDKNTLMWKIPSKELSVTLAKVGSRKFHDLQLVFEPLQ